MPLPRNDLAIFAARVLVIADDVNKEHRMSVQVQALAEVVRNANLAIANAQTAAVRMRNSATRVVDRVAEVENMIKSLDDAEAELGKALGTVISNGAPPLDDTPATSPVTLQAAPTETVDSSITKVQALNTPAA